jgi:hypothetical protein
MEDLGRYAADAFQLVVALGIYHCAASQAAWDKALRETVRILAPRGRLLVAHFTPRANPRGLPLTPAPGERHLYTGFRSGPHILLDRDDLDAEMRRHGLHPAVASVTVTRRTERGVRVTVNALYRKRGSES